MIRTYGLTHIALAVRDAGRAAKFYEKVFGSVVVNRGDGFLQIQTPGTRDVIVLEERDKLKAGTSGGIAHFGLRLQNPKDVDAAAHEIRRAGGFVKSQGEFCPGEPYVFASDLDGDEIEVWYELPTPVDPPAPRARTTTKKRKTPSRAR
jgi:catechol-2,3-dioxygenase